MPDRYLPISHVKAFSCKSIGVHQLLLGPDYGSNNKTNSSVLGRIVLALRDESITKLGPKVSWAAWLIGTDFYKLKPYVVQKNLIDY